MTISFNADAWRSPRTGRISVWFPEHMCQEVPWNLRSVAQLAGAISSFHRDGCMPCQEFLDWADAMNIEFHIDQCWGDGCHVFIPRHGDAALAKLRFGDQGVAFTAINT